MKKAIFFAVALLFFSSVVYAQKQTLQDIKEKAQAAEERVASKIDTGVTGTLTESMDYLHKVVLEEGKKEPQKMEVQESIILTVGDLVVSLLCLCLAVFLVTKVPASQKYLWFLFVFNVSWLVLIVISKGVWSVLDYLVIKLEPKYAATIYDHFFIIFVIVSMLVFIWLLARTFGMNFFGAVGSFVLAHVFYFFVVAFVFTVFTFNNESRIFTLARENIGIRSVIRNYAQDMNNIAKKADIGAFIKVKYYHL
jgi:hypothetical protein